MTVETQNYSVVSGVTIMITIAKGIKNILPVKIGLGKFGRI